MPQYNKKKFVFDHERTKHLANLFAKEKNIEKIFLTSGDQGTNWPNSC